MVEDLGAGVGDRVLELGPGHGELSRHLIGRVARLILVEKDDDLAASLERRWGDRRDVQIHAGDALEMDLGALVAGPGPYRVISNVPYHITSPLLFAVLELEPPPLRVVLTLQKEVAERIVAAPGTKAYGALSVGVRAVARAEIRFSVSRSAFRPVPEVDSAVVRIEPKAERPPRGNRRSLRRLTRVAFGRRRKQLQKILRTAPEYSLSAASAKAVCEELGVDPRVRPERLRPEQFLELAARLESAAER